MGVLCSSVVTLDRWCHHPTSPVHVTFQQHLTFLSHVAGRNFSQGCFQSQQRAQGNSQFFTKTVETISRRHHWLFWRLKKSKGEVGHFFWHHFWSKMIFQQTPVILLSFWNEYIRLLWLWQLLSWCLSRTWHSHLLMHNTLIYDISHLPPVDLKKKA